MALGPELVNPDTITRYVLTNYKYTSTPYSVPADSLTLTGLCNNFSVVPPNKVRQISLGSFSQPIGPNTVELNHGQHEMRYEAEKLNLLAACHAAALQKTLTRVQGGSMWHLLQSIV